MRSVSISLCVAHVDLAQIHWSACGITQKLQDAVPVNGRRLCDVETQTRHLALKLVHFPFRWSDYTVSEREEIGRQCKRVIDAGRLKYLESHDFTARLAFYVDSSVSLENAVLLAKPKT